MTEPVEVTLLYDADCGFCTRAASWLRRWGVPGVRSMQSVDLAAWGVDADRATREIPAVLPDGTVLHGADAIIASLAGGPVATRVAAAVLGAPVLRHLSRWTYRLVARHRHRLPGGSDACALD